MKPIAAKKPYYNADSQIKQLSNELRGSISSPLFTDINKYIYQLADCEMDRINQKIESELFNRLEAIERKLADSKLSKSEESRLMNDYYKLIHPKTFIDILNKSITMTNAQSAYHQFYKKVSTTNDFPAILKRYRAPDSIFKAFSHYIMAETKPLLQSFQSHSEKVNEHFELLRHLAEEKGAKAAFQIGAGLVGSFIAGPLGGIVTRKVMGALSNDEQYIHGSLQEVRQTWQQIAAKWENVKRNIHKEYIILYFTLIGGYFKKTAKDFDDLGYSITGYDSQSFNIKLEVKETEQKRLITWMLENERLLAEALQKKNFPFAQQLTTNLLQYFSSNKTAAKISMPGSGCSLMETAQLYRYGVYQHQIDTVYWQQGKYEEAVLLYMELLNKLTFSVTEFNKMGSVMLTSITGIVVRMLMAAGMKDEHQEKLKENLEAFAGNGHCDSKSDVWAMIQVFAGYVTPSRANEKKKLDFTALYERYAAGLETNEFAADSFLIYLKRKSGLQKTGLLAVNRWIATYQDMADKHTYLKPKIAIPALIFLFITMNGIVFAQAGKFTPAFLDRFYFENVEGKWLHTNLDHHAFQQAIDRENMERALFLLASAKVEADQLNEDGNSLLSLAAAKGDMAAVEELLDYGSDVNLENLDGSTPLWLAYQNGDPAMFRFLLEQGADPNIDGPDGPLVFQLIDLEDTAYLDLFTAHGGDINAADQDGLLPIQQAILLNDATMLEKLLALGADPLLDGEAGHAIDLAVDQGDADMIELLLEHVVTDDRLRDEDLRVVLQWAVAAENSSIAEQVMSVRSFDVDQSLLVSAINKGNLEMVQLLLAGGADPSGTSSDDAPIIVAAKKENLELMRLLINAGASIDATNADQQTSAIMASSANDKEWLTELLSLKPDLSLVDGEGMTAFDYALANGYLDIADLLMQNGNGDAFDIQQSLHAAINNNDLEMVETILQLGADPNGLNEEGVPVIVAAVEDGYLNLVELLINYEADLTLINENGETLLTIAEETGMNALVSLLSENGALEQADFDRDQLVGYWKRIPSEDSEDLNIVASIKQDGDSYIYTEYEEGEKRSEEITATWDDGLQVGSGGIGYNYREDQLSAFWYDYERISQSAFQAGMNKQLAIIEAEQTLEQAKTGTYMKLAGYWNNTAESTTDYHYVNQISVEESSYMGWKIVFHENGHTGNISNLTEDSIEAIEGNTVYFDKNDLKITFENKDTIVLTYDFLDEGDTIKLVRE